MPAPRPGPLWSAGAKGGLISKSSLQRTEGFDTMPRDLAILACTECKRRNYTTTRNKKTMAERLEKVKFCPFDRKRTVHKEVK